MSLNLAVLKRDFVAFARLLKVYSKPRKRLVQFDPKPEQLRYVELLESSENPHLVTVKARQVGITTVTAAYFLWKLYFATEPLSHAIISLKDRSSVEILDTIRKMHASLPKLLRRPLSIDNKHTMQFKDTGARFDAYTAKARDGATRSFVASSAHISEFAYWEDQRNTLADIQATVGNGPLIIETTVNGPGDYYHDLVLSTQEPDSEWQLFFSPWYEDRQYVAKPPANWTPSPVEQRLKKRFHLTDEQLWWRHIRLKTMGDKFYKEFPSTPEEAFESLENLFFPKGFFSHITPCPLNGQWALPFDDQDQYVMGVDVGGGVGQDYTAVCIVSRSQQVPAFYWRANTLLPEQAADIIMSFYHQYKHPYTLVESNNHGHLLLYRLRSLGLYNLYKNHGKPWVTTRQSKVFAFDLLKGYLERTDIHSLPAPVIQELKSLQSTGNKAPAAPGNAHDDLAMATALAYVALDARPHFIHPNTYKAMWEQHRLDILHDELNQNPGGFKRRRL